MIATSSKQYIQYSQYYQDTGSKCSKHGRQPRTVGLLVYWTSCVLRVWVGCRRRTRSSGDLPGERA